jgi:hypothetical protein
MPSGKFSSIIIYLLSVSGFGSRLGAVILGVWGQRLMNLTIDPSFMSKGNFGEGDPASQLFELRLYSRENCSRST